MLIFLVLLFLENSYAAKGHLMLAEESKKTMWFEEAEAYCQKLRSKGFSDWRIPEKEELDQFKRKTSKRYWTNSRMFAVGPHAKVVYSFSKGGFYGPSGNEKFKVLCIRG